MNKNYQPGEGHAHGCSSHFHAHAKCDCGYEGSALPAPTASALTDEKIAEAAYKGYDEYWTEDCAGLESEAWAASGRAVLALQPAMSGAAPTCPLGLEGSACVCGVRVCAACVAEDGAAQPASSSAPAVGAVAWADMKPWMRDFLVRGGGFVRTLYNEPHDAINRTDVGAWIQTASDMLQRSQFAAPSTGQDAAQEVDEGLHAFLDEAAGYGLVLGGIDAADLYVRLFPDRYAAALAAQGDGGTTA